jgi:hypothetical protein
MTSILVKQYFCDSRLVSLGKNEKELLGKYASGNFIPSDSDLLESSKIPSLAKVKFKNAGKELVDHFDNGKSLFETLRVSPLIASDQRLWVYLTHVHFKDYMFQLRPITKETSGDYIKDHYFCSTAKGLLYNDVALLWWLFHLTVLEEEGQGRYRLTEEVFSMRDYTRHLFSGKQGRANGFRHGVLEYVIENKDLFSSNKANKIRLVMRSLNSVAGSSLISGFSKEEIKKTISLFRDKIASCDE